MAVLATDKQIQVWIEVAKSSYVAGRIDLDQLEEYVEQALQGIEPRVHKLEGSPFADPRLESFIEA